MARRARGSRIGPRSLIALVLVGFLVVATGVIARRTFGISQARTLRTLERQRDALDASRVRLAADIRDATSRSRLMAVAERLHMYVPPDSQVIILKRPTR